MADVAELKKRLSELKEALKAKLPDIAFLISLSAKAMAERNIKDKGFGPVYSTETIPAWFLEGKELNKSGEAFLSNKKKKGEETNWGQLRAAQGLQNEHVDLSYSNKMWAAMAPEPGREEGGLYLAPLAGGNKESQDKMNWNRDRYGDFIGNALTKDNIQTLFQVAADEVIQLFEQTGINFNQE